MKTRKIIIEVICFVLLMNFFYEGIYKVAYWQQFGAYLKHAPLTRYAWQPLTYGIPIGEIVLALSFFKTSFRMRALYISIISFLLFVFWVMCSFLFTNTLFWPFHALWAKPTWIQKMLIALGLCWMAFAAIVLLKSNPSLKRNSNSLRNIPVSAS